MITINATGDTTIHTANKYCPEDILVKVPAGGSGGSGGLEELSTTIVDNGMYEPGMNEYIITIPGLNLSTRQYVILVAKKKTFSVSSPYIILVLFMFAHNPDTNSFDIWHGDRSTIDTNDRCDLDENTIRIYGADLVGDDKTYHVYAI